MTRFLFALALLLACVPGWSRDLAWYVYSREKGCVAPTEAVEAFPALRHGTTPTQWLARLRKQYPDATLEPFLTGLAKAHQAEGSTASAQERDAYKGLTPSNALVVRSTQLDIDLAFFTRDACRSLGWLDAK